MSGDVNTPNEKKAKNEILGENKANDFNVIQQYNLSSQDISNKSPQSKTEKTSAKIRSKIEKYINPQKEIKEAIDARREDFRKQLKDAQEKKKEELYPKEHKILNTEREPENTQFVNIGDDYTYKKTEKSYLDITTGIHTTEITIRVEGKDRTPVETTTKYSGEAAAIAHLCSAKVDAYIQNNHHDALAQAKRKIEEKLKENIKQNITKKHEQEERNKITLEQDIKQDIISKFEQKFRQDIISEFEQDIKQDIISKFEQNFRQDIISEFEQNFRQDIISEFEQKFRQDIISDLEQEFKQDIISERRQNSWQISTFFHSLRQRFTPGYADREEQGITYEELQGKMKDIDIEKKLEVKMGKLSEETINKEIKARVGKLSEETINKEIKARVDKIPEETINKVDKIPEETINKEVKARVDKIPEETINKEIEVKVSEKVQAKINNEKVQREITKDADKEFMHRKQNAKKSIIDNYKQQIVEEITQEVTEKFNESEQEQKITEVQTKINNEVQGRIDNEVQGRIDKKIKEITDKEVQEEFIKVELKKDNIDKKLRKEIDKELKKIKKADTSLRVFFDKYGGRYMNSELLGEFYWVEGMDAATRDIHGRIAGSDNKRKTNFEELQSIIEEIEDRIEEIKQIPAIQDLIHNSAAETSESQARADSNQTLPAETSQPPRDSLTLKNFEQKIKDYMTGPTSGPSDEIYKEINSLAHDTSKYPDTMTTEDKGKVSQALLDIMDKLNQRQIKLDEPSEMVEKSGRYTAGQYGKRLVAERLYTDHIKKVAKAVGEQAEATHDEKEWYDKANVYYKAALRNAQIVPESFDLPDEQTKLLKEHESTWKQLFKTPDDQQLSTKFDELNRQVQEVLKKVFESNSLQVSSLQTSLKGQQTAHLQALEKLQKYEEAKGLKEELQKHIELAKGRDDANDNMDLNNMNNIKEMDKDILKSLRTWEQDLVKHFYHMENEEHKNLNKKEEEIRQFLITLERMDLGNQIQQKRMALMYWLSFFGSGDQAALFSLGRESTAEFSAFMGLFR